MSQMYGAAGMAKNILMPDDEEQRRKRIQMQQRPEIERRLKEEAAKRALPPIADDAPMTMGGPKFNAPAAPAATASAAGAARPVTRTISNLPAGYTEQQVRDQLSRNGQLARRMAIDAMGAGAAGNRDAQEAIIRQRHDLEDDSRTLGATLPRSYVADPTEGRMRLGRIAYNELMARRSMQQPEQMDPALAAGTAMAPPSLRKPGLSPTTELMRQDTLRLKANDPVLEGQGANRRLTTPANQEQERRYMMDQAEMRRREELAAKIEKDFAPPTAEEFQQIDARFEDQQARAKQASQLAPEVMARYAANRRYREEAAKADMDLDLANRQADVAQAKARSSGSDTASEIAKMRAAGEMARVKRETQAETSADKDTIAESYVANILTNSKGKWEGDVNMQENFDQSLNNLTAIWPQMSEAAQVDAYLKLEDLANGLNAASMVSTKARILDVLANLTPVTFAMKLKTGGISAREQEESTKATKEFRSRVRALAPE